jgi:hypothetical protein
MTMQKKILESLDTSSVLTWLYVLLKGLGLDGLGLFCVYYLEKTLPSCHEVAPRLGGVPLTSCTIIHCLEKKNTIYFYLVLLIC